MSSNLFDDSMLNKERASMRSKKVALLLYKILAIFAICWCFANAANQAIA